MSVALGIAALLSPFIVALVMLLIAEGWDGEPRFQVDERGRVRRKRR